jgi:hypothetical protein
LVAACNRAGSDQLRLFLEGLRRRNLPPSTDHPRALRFGRCACSPVVRRTDLRRQIPFVNPSETSCDFLLVTVPKTNQHKKDKAATRKAGEDKQDSANRSCHFTNPPIGIDR